MEEFLLLALRHTALKNVEEPFATYMKFEFIQSSLGPFHGSKSDHGANRLVVFRHIFDVPIILFLFLFNLIQVLDL